MSAGANNSATGQVWYVSYGSNMCRARLEVYLAGGRPAGGARTYPGARDRTLPAEDVAVELPGKIYFAGQSQTWGGGMAFYDHGEPGPTPARAYRISAAQFADVAAQEMRRIPQENDPLEKVVLGDWESGRHTAGPGRYETLIRVGVRDGLPMLTFTAPHGLRSVPHTRPTQPYLAMLAQGLREARGWDDRAIEQYFESLLS